jgi:hypothetical protein
MSRDLISSAYQVLSSNELEIQELVQRISSARYLDEETKEKIINELSAALLGRAADKADKKVSKMQKKRGAMSDGGGGNKPASDAEKKARGQRGKFERGEHEKSSQERTTQNMAQGIYSKTGKAPSGWKVKDGRVYKA